MVQHRGEFEMSRRVTHSWQRSLALAVLLAAAAGAAGAASPPAKVTLPWIRSARTGPWSAPATWEGGKVPTAGDRVQVRTDHTVHYDVKSDQVIRAIHVAGTLRFAT